MKYKSLIIEAWNITKNNPHLKWLNFVAGFYFLFLWLVRSRYLLPDQYLDTHQIIDLASHHIFWTIIIFIFLYITYSIIPLILNAAIITSIAGIKQNNPYKISQAISMGLLRFLPLYEFRMFFTPLRVITSASILLMAWKYLGVHDFWQLAIASFFCLIVLIILRFLFAYTEYFVVLCNTKFLRAIKNSLLLILFFGTRTLILTILLFIISIMVLLNAFMWIVVPLGLSYFLGFILAYLSPLMAYMIWGILSLLMFYLFLNTYAFYSVFTRAVWTLAFFELLEKYKAVHLKKIRNIPNEFKEDDEKKESWEIMQN